MSNTFFVDKQTVIQADWLNDVNNFVYSGQFPVGSPAAISKDTIGDLRALDKTKVQKAFIFGYYAKGDGGGGQYYYDSADTTSTDNGGTIIVATDGGRWKLTHYLIVSAKQFGARGTGTDDTAAIAAAYLWCANNNKTLWIPSGTYGTTTGFVFDKSINVVGENEQVKLIALNNLTTILKVNWLDRVPAHGYIFTIQNIAIDSNGFTVTNGYYSYISSGVHLKQINVYGTSQGFRLEGDQYCTYEDCRAYNCTIGFRLVDDTLSGAGGGNNNTFINPVAKNNQVSYMFGRAAAPQPLHTVTVINAISLGATFSSYVAYKYSGLTYTNCSPESVVTGSGSASYDGETVKAGLGYFNATTATLRDVTIATNGQTFYVENLSSITFDNYGGANSSVTRDITSIANFVNVTTPGNSSAITATNIQAVNLQSNRTTSYVFPHSCQASANLINHVVDPVTLVNAAAVNPSITAQVDWHASLGVCGSIRINDGSSNKGISPTLDGAAFSANPIMLIGISMVASANCSVNVSYSGHISANFSLVAGVPVRVYVAGGSTASGTLSSFNINILDTSGATVYIGKAQFNIGDDVGGAPALSNIMQTHRYNSGFAWGDVGVHTAAPTLGTFKRGDVVFHRTPSASGNVGWICTTAGTPGTWKTWGTIAA